MVGGQQRVFRTSHSPDGSTASAVAGTPRRSATYGPHDPKVVWNAVGMKTIAFPQVGAEPEGAAPQLTRFAWLSIATAVATIGLKSVAYLVTGSVGLLSDAAESGVNLVAAVVALVALTVAPPPPRRRRIRGRSRPGRAAGSAWWPRRPGRTASATGRCAGIRRST
jgi:hypothetical protein